MYKTSRAEIVCKLRFAKCLQENQRNYCYVQRESYSH